MPKNTESNARRRREAIHSAVISTAWLVISAAVLLFLRWYYRMDSFWGALLLIGAVLDLGAVVPIWVLLRTRLQEIEGGEEDAAAQY